MSKPVDTRPPRDARDSLLYKLGWWLLLATLVVVPLAQANGRFVGVSSNGVFLDDLFGLPKAVAAVALISCALAAWSLAVVGHRETIRVHWILVPAGLTVVWAAVSTIFSVSPALSLLGARGRGEGLITLLAFAAPHVLGRPVR